MTVWAVAFVAYLATLVTSDLSVFGRKLRVVTPGEAAVSAANWVVAALLFSLVLVTAYREGWVPVGHWLRREEDPTAAWLQFIGAYLVEVSLSLDNLTVVALILTHFQVAPGHRLRALFWVIVSSLLVRSILMAAGVSVLHLEWTRWIFAGLLVLGAVRAFVMPDEESRLEGRLLVRSARAMAVGRGTLSRWFVASPIAMAVVVASAADLTMAFDSIPAVFSITADPIVAISSNLLAIMMLRSLYFALAGVIGRLRYLRVGMFVVLFGLAFKVAFLKDERYPTFVTVLSVLGIVGLSVAASVPAALRASRASAQDRPTPLDDVTEAVASARRNLRKVAVLIVGTAVLIAAVLIGPLPGPGFSIVAPIGIAILATEFVWARSLLGKLKVLQDKTDQFVKTTPVWTVPIVVIGFWLGLWGIAVLLHHYFEKVNTPLVFTLAGGGFVPVSFWAYRTVVMDFRRRGWIKSNPEAPADSGGKGPGSGTTKKEEAA